MAVSGLLLGLACVLFRCYLRGERKGVAIWPLPNKNESKKLKAGKRQRCVRSQRGVHSTQRGVHTTRDSVVIRLERVLVCDSDRSRDNAVWLLRTRVFLLTGVCERATDRLLAQQMLVRPLMSGGSQRRRFAGKLASSGRARE